MPIDFDVKTFLEHIQGLKPPYECPVKECGKVYKSLTGMQNHIYSYDHDNPENNTPSKKPGSIRKKPGHWRKGGVNGGGASPGPEIWKKSTRDPLTYAEAQRVVEVDLDGEIHRINIYDPLEVISQDQIDNCDNTEKEEMLQKAALKGGKGGKGKDVAKGKQKKEPGPNSTANGPKLPEASFKILDDYVRPQRAPVRSETYFRFIEKTTEVLDEEVEYDMDEEDHAWLQLINEQRRKDNLSVVTQENFEMLMDRFEKEAFFQSQSAGKDSGPPIDDDAVCAICMDGECQNSNVILFCDMCNLAVHQECYGVPYIPEGQWLCRRCLHSPSRAVDCCLCPNKGGAFKQTDDGRWAHVVCALWIPEVGFSNTVFLEPIDSIASIPPARWKLTCYICKQRGSSACIQCHKSNCYTAFHVTCAQQAGLFMKIEPVRESSVHGATINVRKTAFCDSHTPPNMDFHPMIDNGVSDNEENKPKSMTPGEIKAKSRNVMRKARKILAEKRNAVPVVSIPTISPRKMDKIASTVSLTKKNQFLGRLQSYWTLKRQSRNGVPLLRRLQSSHMSRNREQSQTDSESQALREQLKYWQRLRQDLERARLLVELIRKREKLKREQLRLQQLATEMKLTPFLMLLRHTLDQLDEVDSTSLFAEPVDTNEVDDYLTVISEPMDLRTMRVKIENHEYSRIEQFEAHFDLMVSNCLRYNNRDTPFYKQGIRMRDQGGAVLRAARRMAERVGYDPETGLHLAEPPADVPPLPVADEDNFLAGARREGMPLEEQLRALLDRLDILNATRPKRNKLATQIKREVVKVRRQLALQKGERLLSEEEDANRSALDTPAESEPEEEQEEGRARNSTPAPDTNLSSPARSGRGHGRGRGRPRGRPPARARRTSLQDTDTSMAAGDASEEGDEDGSSSRAPSPHPVEDTPASPVSRGPGRRASGYRQSRRSSQDSVVEEEGARDGTEQRAASVGSEATDATGRASRSAAQSTDMETSVKDATPVVEVKKRQSHRGTPSIKRRSAGPAAEGGESKRSRGVAAAAGDGGAAGSPIPRNKDSFRTYRQLSGAFESELEETSDNSSTEESISTSDTGDSSDSDADDDTELTKPERSKCDATSLYVSQRGHKGHQENVNFNSARTPSKRSSPRKGKADATLTSKALPGNVTPKSAVKSKSHRKGNTLDVDGKQKSILQYFSSPTRGSGGEKENRFDDSEASALSPLRRSCSKAQEPEEQATAMGAPGDGSVGEGSDFGDPPTPPALVLELDKLTNALVSMESMYQADRSRFRVETWSGEIQETGALRGEKSSENSDDTRRGTAGVSPGCETSLEPLDLVWAKCRGYPWYPALIINPKMPKTGYFHNGVPIPVPPDDVLQLQNKYDEPVFLVLFFDTKRTWQWLPSGKLEPLGVDSCRDKGKLLDNKKPNVRKSVRRAYEKAIIHRCRVTGEPNPLLTEVADLDTDAQ